jgi:hypothetical protein
MLLPAEEAALFFSLHGALMQFVNEQLRIVGDEDSVPAYPTLSPEKRREVVRALVGRLDLIDAFIAANPAGFSPEQLDVVSSWRHLVCGRFIALRQLKKHMILLTGKGPPTAYGLVGLTDPIELVIGRPLPTMVEAVLLPFRGRIIYDGLIGSFNVTFASGARRALEVDFRSAKAGNRVLTSLPGATADKPQDELSKPKQPGTPGAATRSPQQVLAEITGMTDSFCQTHLNEEYAELCREAAGKLARKRPSPLLRGRTATWACGILRSIGWANFLDDPSQSPYFRMTDIDRAFGIAESTGQGKAKAIRRMLKIQRFNHHWMLPSRWEKDPMIWTLRDPRGLLFDIRREPVATQRAAFRQGLIPFVPADRAAAAVKAQVAASSGRRLFQFKIALRGTDPLVWRRIQVLDGTLDQLHEHFQTAMGWTNSHLHEFIIQGQRCGDPELLEDGIEPRELVDSTRTPVSAVLPADGAPRAFEYCYDFGDGWVHDVLHEGCPPPQPGTVYPQCLEGERACPPEDVGGIDGYARYLEAMADPSHDRHQEMLAWRGPFNPDAFDSCRTTHIMQEGLPDWRKMGGATEIEA